MIDETEIIRRIRVNAELVVSVAAKELGVEIRYDQAGVEWLDGYIQRQHEQGDPGLRDALAQRLGSYLGECMVRALGGEWANGERGWAVRFSAGNEAYPFTKVRKHLEHGAEDSVLGFYKSAAAIFKRPA